MYQVQTNEHSLADDCMPIASDFQRTIITILCDLHLLALRLVQPVRAVYEIETQSKGCRNIVHWLNTYWCGIRQRS